MHNIYKYPLVIADEQALELPVDSNILSVVNQKIELGRGTMEELVLYAMTHLLLKGEAMQKVFIRIIGTGHPVNINSLDGYTFLNTVQQNDFMWHVYYKKGEIIN